MDFLRSVFLPPVPMGVIMMSWATAIRWVAFGFVQYLLPVFLFSFTGSYMGAGFLSAIVSIVSLSIVPFVGYIANKISAKHIMLTGILIYPLVGISYYLAGIFGAVGFIIVARILNGFAWTFDEIGRKTYFRRHTEKDQLATTLGFFETITGFLWVFSVLAGLVLVDMFEIHELLLLLVPFSLAAFFIVLRIPKDKADKTDLQWKKYFFWKSHLCLMHEISLWGRNLKKLATTSFLAGFILTGLSFFVPIFIFLQEDGSFQKVIILMLIFSLPGLFGSPLGVIADKMGKHSIPLAFTGVGILLIFLTIATSFTAQLFIMFSIGLFILFFTLSVESEVTKATDNEHYGSLSSSMLGIDNLSTAVAPIALGFFIDKTSFHYVILGLAALSFFLVILNKR